MTRALLLFLAFTCAAEALASKKDFKGLFGSYRRERFTENEARDNAFGLDLMLSTLLPLSPIVKSQEATGGAFNALNYATFFNVEGGIHFSLWYNWQLFLHVGYYTYETRKENAATEATNPELPLFHQFEMTAVPVLAGFKYRFSTQDIVPYAGLGVGFSSVKRRASYESSPNLFDQQVSTVIAAQAIFGVEFYIASNAGIRLETSAFYFKLPTHTFLSQGNPAITPNFEYQPNPWSVRYASGLFFLF